MTIACARKVADSSSATASSAAANFHIRFHLSLALSP